MASDRIERLRLALDTKPDWFSLTARTMASLRGVATTSSNSAEGERQTALDIALEPSGVRVRELVPGTRFPARCPERHIEAGGWFCLGLSSGWAIADVPSAHEWWGALDTFLQLQRVAERTRIWPERHALSHGSAGVHHKAALDAAERSGLSEAYANHVLGQPSIIAYLDARLARTGDRLLNGRAPCPCGREGRGGRPILRRKCPPRADVLGLLVEERRRVTELRRYWALMKEAGVMCCGTMKSCPLRDGQVPASDETGRAPSARRQCWEASHVYGRQRVTAVRMLHADEGRHRPVKLQDLRSVCDVRLEGALRG